MAEANENSDGLEIKLTKVESGDASNQLAAWLSAETSDVQKAVNGDVFERPITSRTIQTAWKNLEESLKEDQCRALLSQEYYLTTIKGENCGFIEINIMKSITEEDNVINLHCESEPFAMLSNIFVLPGHRGKG